MSHSSINHHELSKFTKTEEEWWDLHGEFKLLHQINPFRLDHIISQIQQYLHLPYQDIRALDVGCGGGLISAPLARLGVQMSALDANNTNIETVKSCAKKQDLNISTFHSTVEEHAKLGKKYNLIICLEVIEHVENVQEFLQNLTSLLDDNGILILSTINRTKKSFLLAKFMAEYVLRWVPQGTHDYNKFLKPSEIVEKLDDQRIKLVNLTGLTFSCLFNKWQLSEDIDVNYFATFISK